jgi:succinate dehydrogenase (ubiquinone) membrane anchor subunit
MGRLRPAQTRRGVLFFPHSTPCACVGTTLQWVGESGHSGAKQPLDRHPLFSHPSSSLTTTADTAPALKKLYHQSALALAGLVPLAAFQQQGDTLGRVVDVGLNAALPVHGHIAMNYVVTDYVPKAVAGIARWGVLGGSVLAAVGMARLNVSGAGVTQTVKALWAREAPPPKQKK